MTNNCTYTHWGTLTMGNGNTIKEPNGKGPPPDQCVVANYTQAWADNSTMASNASAFGWADTKCSRKFVSICRIMREWPAGRCSPCCKLLPGHLTTACMP